MTNLIPSPEQYPTPSIGEGTSPSNVIVFPKANINNVLSEKDQGTLENNNRKIDLDACRGIFLRILDLLEPQNISDVDDFDIQPKIREEIELLSIQIPELSDSDLIGFYRETLGFGNVVAQEHYELLIKGIRISKDRYAFSLAIFAPFGLRRKPVAGGNEINILELAISRRGGFWKSKLLEYAKNDGQTNEIKTVETAGAVGIDSQEKGEPAGEGEYMDTPRESKAKKGNIDRRLRSKLRVNTLLEERELEAKKLIYQQALERLQALGLNIDQQLTDFSRFLMGHIPYVVEIIRHLETLAEIRKLEREHQYLSESLKEGSRSDEIGDLERELINLNGDIVFYETEITIAQGRINTEVKKDSPVSLVVSNTNSLIRNYTQKKEKAIREKVRLVKRIESTKKKEEERIQENKAHIEQLLTQASTTRGRIEELDAIIQNRRIRKISTIDEFISGFYTSLRAQEFYTTPNTPTKMEVNLNWIESNILDLLVGVLKNLDAINKQITIEGISLPEIVELFKDIQGISSADVSYDIASLPDIEEISQQKVAKLISVFKNIIPADKLDTIPIFISNKRPKKNKEFKKTKSERRREAIEKSDDTQKEKNDIRNIIESLEEQQKGFRKYWELKIDILEADLRGISRAITAIGINAPLKNGKFKGKNIDELIAIKDTKTTELESLGNYLRSNKLNNNIELFEKLKKEIGRLQKKLSKIK